MSEVSFGKSLSLAQAAKLIVTNPTVRFMLRGEPGIGKSSLLEFIAAETGYDYAYIDVPNMDLGDIAMPVIDHESRTTKYYPNARFKMHEGKPVIIMLDEFTKGAQPVQNMLHPLLEKANPRLGDIPVPAGSIIFMTGNLTTDGVGDNIKGHSLNRIVEIEIAKADAEAMLEYANGAGAGKYAPEVMAWIHQYPHALASYRDAGQADNPYIYNPKKQSKSYVSPRSLETASTVVFNRHSLDADSLIAALSGAIGDAAARDLQAYVEYADQLPTRDAILKSPKTAAVPTSAGACSVVTFNLVTAVTKDTFNPIMDYMGRLSPEWQSVFAIQVARSAKQSIAFSNAKFGEWLAANQDLL